MFAMDIETTERIGEALSDMTDDVYVVHSQVASSNRKKDQIVRQRIDQFAAADHGVLIAPKLLDEGIDVPDAEVGINVAGTKTKLQLVQRMGRVLRKHADQQPQFHHFVAVPDEHHIEGLDGKHYVQELNWVCELGEAIGEQPSLEKAHVDSGVLERAEKRGHELWAQDLLADLEVETVQSTVHLDELIEDLTLEAAQTLHTMVDFDTEELRKDEWQTAMDELRSSETVPVDVLQRVWWLFPLYSNEPAELEALLTAIIGKKQEQADTESGSGGHPPNGTGPATTETERSTDGSVSDANGSTQAEDSATASERAENGATREGRKESTASPRSESDDPEHDLERPASPDELTTETSAPNTHSTGKGDTHGEHVGANDEHDTGGQQTSGEHSSVDSTRVTGDSSDLGARREPSESARSTGDEGGRGRTVTTTETGTGNTPQTESSDRQSPQSSRDRGTTETSDSGVIGRIRSLLGM